MYKRVPFRRWHINWLEEKGDAVEGTEFKLDSASAWELEKARNNWTVVYDGDPITCGGLLELWPGRYQAWMFLNPKSGRHMLAITREVLKVLEQAKGRIELSVRHDFESGHRWAKMLGFKVETPVMTQFGPDGADHTGYVRIN